MPSTRKRQGSSSRSTPYDMGNINNWYADQFRTKLAEWNIVAPPNFSKAELKSLYLANLSQRSIESQPSEVPHGSHLPQEASCTSATDNLNPDNTETLSQQPRQELSSQTSVLLNMVNTMSSLVKQVLDKQEGKDDVGRQTLDAFSTNRTQMHTGTCNISDTNLVANENFGIHPEQIRNIDFVTETVRDKILSGKYVNLATLLIPEYTDQLKKDTYRDARLNRSLSIEEFIVAFNKYKRIHCTRHAWRKAELDAYEASIIEISRVYGKKFYEYHKIFSQKCAMALEQGKKVNWAEKDKDLLQMIIGGTACNACGICKEVSHATMFCPQHTSQLGVYKQQGQYTNTTTHNNNMNTRATQICHFFNGNGCKRELCQYMHACKICKSFSHGQKQCTAHQISTLVKPAQRFTQSSSKKN